MLQLWKSFIFRDVLPYSQGFILKYHQKIFKFTLVFSILSLPGIFIIKEIIKQIKKKQMVSHKLEKHEYK